MNLKTFKRGSILMTSVLSFVFGHDQLLLIPLLIPMQLLKSMDKSILLHQKYGDVSLQRAKL